MAAAKFVNFSLAQFYHSATHGKWTIILYNPASVELKFSFLRKLRGWIQKRASMSRGQLLRLALGPAVPFFFLLLCFLNGCDFILSCARSVLSLGLLSSGSPLTGAM